MIRIHVTTESVKTKSEATSVSVAKDIPEETARQVIVTTVELIYYLDIYILLQINNVIVSVP